MFIHLPQHWSHIFHFCQTFGAVVQNISAKFSPENDTAGRRRCVCGEQGLAKMAAAALLPVPVKGTSANMGRGGHPDVWLQFWGSTGSPC